MKPTIQKPGDGFYIIGPMNPRGHKTATGQMLVASDATILNFRFGSDPEGVNLDPVNVLSALHDHLKDHPAAEHLLDAIEALSGTASAAKEPVGEVITPPVHKKPGPKAKKQPLKEEAA